MKPSASHHHANDHRQDGRTHHGPASDDHEHGHEHPSGLRGAIHRLIFPHSHDVSDSIDDAMQSSAKGIRAVKISLLGLGLTAAFQLVVVC